MTYVPEHIYDTLIMHCRAWVNKYSDNESFKSGYRRYQLAYPDDTSSYKTFMIWWYYNYLEDAINIRREEMRKEGYDFIS